MRKIAIGLMSTLSGLVLLFSYHTSTNSGTALASTGTTGGTTADQADGTASGDTSGDGSASSDDSSSSGSSGSSSSSGTFTGDAVMTRWGVVQVEITVENGKITKSEAVQYPQENHRDVEINSYAVPVLNENAVAAQSADLDAISGATVTTDGYVESLQSAIDQAHL